MNKTYLITARVVGGFGIYDYVSSPTQGEQMLPFSHGRAYRFNSLEEAQAKLEQMQKRYKGLYLWRIEPENA